MTEVFQSLAIALFAVLPGALYVWSFEREAGSWGINAPDRFFRFLGVSAFLQILAAPITYWTWAHYIHSGVWDDAHHLPWSLYLILLGYAFVPVALGRWFGHSAVSGGRLARILHGDLAPPRAWDYFFSQKPDGWVRLYLKTGVWLGGPYASGAYAAGYPEKQDIYLPQLADVDPDTGAFNRDAHGQPILTTSALLARWDEVEYLVFDDA